MLIHIILFVFKLIGILLLGIFCLAVLLICVFLFTPLKYKGELSGKDTTESIKGNLFFSWFLHLISGHLSYENEGLSWSIRVAWKKLNQAKKEEPITKSRHAEKRKIPKKPASVEKKERLTEIERDGKKREQHVEKEETPLEAKWSKMLGTLKKLYDKAEVMKRFLCDEIHKAAFFKAIKEVKQFLFRIKPRRLAGEVCYGFEDPSVTGNVFGVISMAQSFFLGQLSIQPDFERKRLEGDVIIAGNFCAIFVVILGLKLIADKNIRITYKQIRRLISKLNADSE